MQLGLHKKEQRKVLGWQWRACSRSMIKEPEKTFNCILALFMKNSSPFASGLRSIFHSSRRFHAIYSSWNQCILFSDHKSNPFWINRVTFCIYWALLPKSFIIVKYSWYRIEYDEGFYFNSILDVFKNKTFMFGSHR